MDIFILTAALLAAFISSLLCLYLIRKTQWLIKLSERIKRSNDRQFRQLFRQIQLLDALQRELSLPRALPPTGGKAGSADFLKSLADHVLEAKPNVVVECGSGLSTLVIARCLQLNGAGHVFSLEHMTRFLEETGAELKRQGLSDWASVLDAPLDSYELSGQAFRWYRTDRLPNTPIDLLIVDGPPARTGSSPRYPAGPMLFPRLSPNGAVFIDDAGRPEELAVVERWRAQFPNLSFHTNIDDFEKGLCVGKVTAAANRSPA